MIWQQYQLHLPAYQRGFHLITNQVVNQLPTLNDIQVGMLHLFLQHTSASLTINENADKNVRLDFEQVFNQLISEQQPFYLHNDEGPDDLPAHIKASLLGCQLQIPITQGRLALGLWQGIYLGEHRNHAQGRQLIATLYGQT